MAPKRSFTPGARIRLHGLQAKPELNGKEGICVEQKVDTGRWLVRLEGGSGEFAFKEANLQLLVAGGSSEGVPVLEALDEMLSQANSCRACIGHIMAHCLDNAAESEAISRRLLSVPRSITSSSVITRLFLVNDILHNAAKADADGGTASFRRLFQENLPETFEKLGRLWLQKLDADEAQGVEATVRQILQVWNGWQIFPPLFTKGLMCLLVSAVPEISAKEANAESDEQLKQKLSRWFSGLNQGSLPYECQMRGLAGKSLTPSGCRARLCHFERFWHLHEGMVVRLRGLLAAQQLNGMLGVLESWDAASGRWKVKLMAGEVKSVKPENLSAAEGASSSRGRNGSSAEAQDPVVSGARAPVFKSSESADIDGVPMTARELELAKQAELQPRCTLPLLKRARRS